MSNISIFLQKGFLCRGAKKEILAFGRRVTNARGKRMREEGITTLCIKKVFLVISWSVNQFQRGPSALFFRLIKNLAKTKHDHMARQHSHFTRGEEKSKFQARMHTGQNVQSKQHYQSGAIYKLLPRKKKKKHLVKKRALVFLEQ